MTPGKNGGPFSVTKIIDTPQISGGKSFSLTVRMFERGSDTKLGPNGKYLFFRIKRAVAKRTGTAANHHPLY